MPAATLTSKGQITIPKEVRESLDLKTGDRVSFRLREDGVAEMIPETSDLLSLCGIFKPEVRGVSIEEMGEAVRRRAGRAC